MNVLERIPGSLGTLKAWPRHGIAFAAGAVSALSFAPFGFWPLMLAGCAALMLLIDAAGTDRRPLRAAALAGWWFGFGQFLVGLHWIGEAFLVDAAAHAWQLPFVAVFFPGGLALLPAAAAALTRRLWRPGPARILVFALCYGLAEWLRGHVLTGFPWNLPAYGWVASSAMLQSTAVFGAYGLSLLTVLFGASLAELTGPGRRRLPVAMAIVFALMWAGGAARLATTPTRWVPGVWLRLVQPAIPQKEKFRQRYLRAHWQRLTRMSEQPAAKTPTIVIWPESTPDFLIARAPIALDWIRELNARGTQLMTGAIRAERQPDGRYRYYNSFYLFSHGRAAATYDKSHLVPFGEYLPFEKTLSELGLKKLTGIQGSFGRGPGPRTIPVTGAPGVGPLICYEILFPGEIVGNKRPGWFVNVTDDSWFGNWAGPQQHLQVARMRAIEEGIPVVRSDNTGISAVIDPLGRIRSQAKSGARTVIDSGLPSAVSETPYSVCPGLGFWLPFGVVFGACLILIFIQKKKIYSKQYTNKQIHRGV